MSETEILDDHLFAFTTFVTIGLQLAFFAVAASCKFDLITDFAGGLNFIVVAVLTLVLGGHYTTRQAVASGIVIASRAELGLFLLYRVCKRGSDSRFDEIRGNCLSFLGFWIFQMIWVEGVSLALIFLNTEPRNPDWEARDTVGAVMAIVGFLFQFVSDLQKYRFRLNKDNKGRACDVGLWSISRHPNYFGEMIIWWGIFVMVTPVLDVFPKDWPWFTIASPLLTMIILLFLSGMPSAEGDVLGRYMKTPEAAERYKNYRERTPILIPFIPAVYAAIPKWFKVVFCFEFPMYEYKEKPANTDPLQPSYGSSDPQASGATKEV